VSRIVAPQKESTQILYQGKWNVYTRWCKDKKLDPFSISSANLADFFIFLFEEKKLAYKTIEGYRTAIAGGIKFVSEIDFGQDPLLSNLLRSFYKERPKASVSFPAWDLAFVLNSLRKEPFEPIGEIELRLLTFKTLFLILFASGARRGEIHAIDYKQVSHTDRWKSVTLFPVSDFVSKTQLRTKGASALLSITIPSLAHTMGSDLKEDRLLCPVRCLKVYLARTQNFRVGKRLLFISYQKGRTADISKNTLSSWVRQLLKLIYVNANRDASKLAGRSTHEIRALSASFAFSGMVDMEDILKACSWKSNLTFIDFYLRGSLRCEEICKLGPLVAAQSIVNL